MPNSDTKALNIWRLDLQSGSATAVTKGKLDQLPDCAPDSKSFLYTSLDNGKERLMEAPIDGGKAEQLSDQFRELWRRTRPTASRLPQSPRRARAPTIKAAD